MKMRKWIITALWVLVGANLIAQTRTVDLLRRADEAFLAEDRALAERLYLQVLDLDPGQSRAVYRLGQLSRNDETALKWFRRYTTLEPDDAWGWLAMGDKLLQTGKAVEAMEAYGRASKLEPTANDVREHLEKGRLRAAPILEPIGGLGSDSDGNRTRLYGLGGSIAIRGGYRLGARISRSDIEDGISQSTIDEKMIRIEGRPTPEFRLALSGGLARLAEQRERSWTTLQADLRFKWNDMENGSSFEVRAQRLPLGVSPLLVVNRAVKDELRVVAELPVGPLRIRAGGRAGLIETSLERVNRRLQGDAALVFPIGRSGEVSAQVHRLGFTRSASAGYFAPRLVETIEGGGYWETAEAGSVSVAVDLGAGIQRLARHGEEMGSWKTALRGWALLAVALSPSVRWTIEAEGYSAPFAPVGVVTAPNWRYVSVITGLEIRIR